MHTTGYSQEENIQIQVGLLGLSAPSFMGHLKSFAGTSGHLNLSVHKINLTFK